MDDKEFKQRKFWATIIVVSIVIIAICGSFLLFRKWGKDADEKRFNEALANMKQTLLVSSSGMRYSINAAGHTVYVKFWTDGMAAASKLAYDGNNEALANWTELKGSMLGLANAFHEQFILIDDAVIFLSLVNESNTDRDLLVFKNRELVYDVVTGYTKGD